jgi:hypothetical protein
MDEDFQFRGLLVRVIVVVFIPLTAHPSPEYIFTRNNMLLNCEFSNTES